VGGGALGKEASEAIEASNLDGESKRDAIFTPPVFIRLAAQFFPICSRRNHSVTPPWSIREANSDARLKLIRKGLDCREILARAAC
jgi:hypothetical protein